MRNCERDEQKAQYLRAIFDAFPHPTFIVDADVQIQDFNTAGEQFLGPEPALALYRRGGEALHCIHAEMKGCGKAAPCEDCVIRNSVNKALTGKTAHRELHKAELRTPKGKRAIDLLVTASLLPYAQPPRVLLVLENVSAFRKLTKSGRSPERRRTTES
jgi:PAS domain-containing protein